MTRSRFSLRSYLRLVPFLLILWLVACANQAPATEEATAQGGLSSSPAATASPLPSATPPPADTGTPTPIPQPSATAEPSRTPIPEGAILGVNALEDFSTLFDQDQGKPRLLLFLTTGCSSCLAAARWLDHSVLAPNPDLDLRVYALWFPMLSPQRLPSELSGRRDESVLNDPRVIHLWDRRRAANEWVAANVSLQGPERSSLRRTYGDLDWGTVIWDTFVFYGPQATWAEAADSAEAAAYPILANRPAIREALGLAQADVAGDGSEGPTRYHILPQESFVTYKVAETLAGRNFNYAIGLTNSISGSLQIDPGDPAASQVGPIQVTIRDFNSDNFLRDERIQNEFLESARYPLATFTPTELRGLPDSYTPGETVEFEILGDLTVRETTVPTTFAVTAQLAGTRLSGTATTQLLMTDFGFDPPAIANLIAAENEVDVTFEFVAVPSSP